MATNLSLVRQENPIFPIGNSMNLPDSASSDKVTMMMKKIKELPQEEQDKCLEIALRLLEQQQTLSLNQTESMNKQLGEQIADRALDTTDRAVQSLDAITKTTQRAIRMAHQMGDMVEKSQILTRQLIKKNSEEMRDMLDSLREMVDERAAFFTDLTSQLKELRQSKMFAKENALKNLREKKENLYNLNKKIATLAMPIFFFTIYLLFVRTSQRKAL